MPPRKRLASVPDAPVRAAVPDLRDAVQEALDGMTWLAASDGALKALALRQAEEIEAATDRAREMQTLLAEAASNPAVYDGDLVLFKRLQKLEAMCDAAKLVGWLGPQLQGVLRDLGGTPGARAAMAPDKPIGGRLAQLRKDAANLQNGGGAAAPRTRSRGAKAVRVDHSEDLD